MYYLFLEQLFVPQYNLHKVVTSRPSPLVCLDLRLDFKPEAGEVLIASLHHEEQLVALPHAVVQFHDMPEILDLLVHRQLPLEILPQTLVVRFGPLDPNYFDGYLVHALPA